MADSPCGLFAQAWIDPNNVPDTPPPERRQQRRATAASLSLQHHGAEETSGGPVAVGRLIAHCHSTDVLQMQIAGTFWRRPDAAGVSGDS